jgi:HEAT repeat protein
MVFPLILACQTPAEFDDPRHQGRTATSWLIELGRANRPRPKQAYVQYGDRQPSLDALRAIGPAAVPACIRALAHDDREVRLAAAQALEMYGAAAEPAIPALVEALVGTQTGTLTEAATTLAAIGAKAEPALEGLLDHEDAFVRLAAANTLFHMNPARDDAFGVLVGGLRAFDGRFRDAIDGWGANSAKYEGVDMVERDGRRFRNRETGMRMTAARYLAALGPAAAPAVPELISALQSRSAAAAAAADALAAIGPDAREAVPVLLHVLAKESGSLELRAAAALGRIGVAASDLPELSRLLAIDQSNAVYTAFESAPPVAATHLGALVSSGDPVAAHNATYALGAMGPRAASAVPALTMALQREPPQVRAGAVLALGKISAGDPAVLAAIRERLNDSDERVRSNARNVLVGVEQAGAPKAPGR